MYRDDPEKRMDDIASTIADEHLNEFGSGMSDERRAQVWSVIYDRVLSGLEAYRGVLDFGERIPYPLPFSVN